MTTSLVKLRKELAKNALDAILISSIPNIIYLTNYSGFSKEEREAKLAHLLVTEDKITSYVRALRHKVGI